MEPRDEDICRCGHRWDDHSSLGNCARCFRCLQFVLRGKKDEPDNDAWEDEPL